MGNSTTKSIIFKKEGKIEKGESLPELTPELIGDFLTQSPKGFRNYADYEITKFDVNFRISIDETRKDITFHYINSLPIYNTENLSPEGVPTEIIGYNYRIILIDTISFFTKIKDNMSELRIYQLGRRYAPKNLTIDDLYGLAGSYYDSGNFDEAIKFYNKILDQIPNDVGALTNIGLALVCIEKYQQAINNYKKALEIEPNDALIWDNLGIAYEFNNDLENAKKAYMKAYELDPEDDEIKEHLEQL